jgi:hypothetical protein
VKPSGTPVSEIFIPGKHSERDAYIDKYTGKKMAMNQISWFIRKVRSPPPHSIG